MDYIFLVFILIFGFFLLIKGAIFFVDGGSSIAKLLNIPPMIIGFTVIAFGTSLPEAAVSITASINNHNGMSMGNIVGSNIFNILMVLGATAFIKNLQVCKSIIKKEMPILIVVSITAVTLSLDLSVSRMDAMILLILFLLFLYDMIKTSLKLRGSCLRTHNIFSDVSCSIISISNSHSSVKSVAISAIGLIFIIVGGKMVVSTSTTIAYSFGISDHLIGATIVSIGTSLPEFVTSIIAATMGERDLAVGNVIGSNLFNILFVLGTSSLISPIYIESKLIIDSLFMIFATIIAYIFVIQDKEITKYESLCLIGLYLLYIIYLI